MSKELVISAASHERRVAILEEGQLVEIYIEREKEFALVGSIYKGRVTRVLPGMQSAFVDIGLDGDAFLYVSDVFENLEDYDHDRGHERNDRGGGQSFRGDSSGDRGRGRFGRRGGRRRGGRPQGGRNLPPSKYASPQGDQRPHESRGPQQGRGFEPRGEHRRPEGSRFSPPAAPPAGSAEDEIVLPGESLAKYRNKPAAAASAPAVVEPEIHEPQPDHDDSVPSRGHVQSGGPGTSSGGNVPRRSSGGLPRWLLAESGNEAETSSTGTEELISSADDTATTARQAVAPDSVESEPTP